MANDNKFHGRRLNVTQEAELRAIMAQNGGTLRPADVLEAARNPASSFHSNFEWSDDVAAESWRLEQARLLVRSFYIKDERSGQEIRVFTSLERDQINGAGYRLMTEVLERKDLRDELVDMAFRELQRMEDRFRNIQELSEVWAQFDSAKESAGKTQDVAQGRQKNGQFDKVTPIKIAKGK